MNRPYDFLKLKCLCGIATKEEVDAMYAILDYEIMGSNAYKILKEKNRKINQLNNK